MDRNKIFFTISAIFISILLKKTTALMTPFLTGNIQPLPAYNQNFNNWRQPSIVTNNYLNPTINDQQYTNNRQPAVKPINNRHSRLSLAEWGNYNIHEPEGPGTYAWGYDIEDPVTGNVQFRSEEKHANGSVTGSYGYVQPDGNVHVVHYIADHLGYRARIENTRQRFTKTVEQQSYENFPEYDNSVMSQEMSAAVVNQQQNNIGDRIVTDRYRRPIDGQRLKNGGYNSLETQNSGYGPTQRLNEGYIAKRQRSNGRYRDSHDGQYDKMADDLQNRNGGRLYNYYYIPETEQYSSNNYL